MPRFLLKMYICIYIFLQLIYYSRNFFYLLKNKFLLQRLKTFYLYFMYCKIRIQIILIKSINFKTEIYFFTTIFLQHQRAKNKKTFIFNFSYRDLIRYRYDLFTSSFISFIDGRAYIWKVKNSFFMP